MRNLRALGHDSLLLYRTGRGTLPDEDLQGLRTETDLSAVLSTSPAAIVVANPTALHVPVALAAARTGCHLFIEKPIAHTFDGVAELAAEVAARQLTVLVGYNFRFHRALQVVKGWLEEGSIGRVVSATAQWGEYLPGWHPWEDHRQGYSARADLGGGAILTMSHPLDYMRWLLGEVQSVSALAGRLGDLEIDVEDAAHILLQFTCGAIGSVQVSYLQRPPSHLLRVTGTMGVIECDVLAGTARRFRAGEPTWETTSPAGASDRNTMFVDEMQHFLACLVGTAQPLVSLEDGVAALRLAVAAKRSATEKRTFEVHVG